MPAGTGKAVTAGARGSRLGVTLLSVALAVLLVGCASPVTSSTGAPASPSSTTAQPCTPTRPNGDAPPGEAASPDFHGNGSLWTVLWPRGVVVFRPGGPGEVRADGSLAMKFPFWRGPGVSAELTITGRSLDQPGLIMTGEVPQGYGLEGFQNSALVFPKTGCWEVTARAGDASLTFVTSVVRRQ